MPLSIEFRLKQILVVESTITKAKIHVKKACTVDLNEGWIDAKGIVDPAAVAFALNKALVDNGIKEKKAMLCINNPSIIYRELTIPKVEDKRIPFVVRSEMTATLDLNREYVIDFAILEELVEEHKHSIRMLAVAISEKALGSYIELCTKVGLKVDVVDTANSSIIKLVQKSDIFDGDLPIIVANIEMDIMKLYLFENKKYILVRNIKLPEIDKERTSEWISDIEDNINKMVQYQYTRPSKVGVKEIVFFGNNPLLSQISSAVAESLDLETLLYPKPDFLGLRDDVYLPYLNAIGTALRK